MKSPPFAETWNRPSLREFAGKYVSLTPLNADGDASALYAASHHTDLHKAVWQYLPYGPFLSQRAMKEWLEPQETLTDRLVFTVTDLGKDLKAGMISIMSIVPEMGCAELGHIWYSPDVQRTKVNTETAYLLLAHLFDDLQYRRAEWKCDARNERSRKAAERLGFVFEGLFRQHRVVKGENRDTAWFSMLDHQWPRRKANFIRWLYEDDTTSLRVMNNGTNISC